MDILMSELQGSWASSASDILLLWFLPGGGVGRRLHNSKAAKLTAHKCRQGEQRLIKHRINVKTY